MTGNRKNNQQFDEMAEQLRARGIATNIFAIGFDRLPLASDLSFDDKVRNHRLEVWRR